MKDLEFLLSTQERTSIALRRRYFARGYAPYRMSKFEEYDLYAKNKDFLVSREVITFTDTDGKLLALKPDVTLSIAKNYDGASLQKLYYNENVYRPAPSGGFSEILQSGVECMGNVTSREVEETIALAAECLSEISERFVLTMSDLGVVEALFQRMNLSEDEENALVDCIRTKNIAEAERLCRASGVADGLIAALSACISASGPLAAAAEGLMAFSVSEEMTAALQALVALANSKALVPYFGQISFDLSVLLNRRFYNGVVFAGYVFSSPRAVLSGGRYDKLMRRLKKDADAIGFAVYLDRLPEEGRVK